MNPHLIETTKYLSSTDIKTLIVRMLHLENKGDLQVEQTKEGGLRLTYTEEHRFVRTETSED